MKPFFRTSWRVLHAAVRDFIADDCPAIAGSLAYFSVLALPSLLLLLIWLSSLLLDEQVATGELRAQLGGWMTPQTLTLLESAIEAARFGAAASPLAWTIGMGALLLASTGALLQLQKALNRAWEVGPDPRRGAVRSFIGKRLLSLGMLLLLAALLMISAAIGALMAAFSTLLKQWLGELAVPLLRVAHAVISLGLLTLLFGALLRLLPDARVPRRALWTGAVLTAVLFSLGQLGLGLYLARANVGGAFGAAGSLALLLVWIYYSALILLLGAEITQALVHESGGQIVPVRGAVRIRRDDPPPTC